MIPPFLIKLRRDGASLPWLPSSNAFRGPVAFSRCDIGLDGLGIGHSKLGRIKLQVTNDNGPIQDSHQS